MRRRYMLATLVLGALSAAALVHADSVVTLPLSPPAKAKPADKAKPAPTTVATAPSEPLSPQAIVEIPTPDFATEPLFPPGVDLNADAFPMPTIEPAMIEAKEKPAAKPAPPLPQPKPAMPSLKEETAPPTAPPEAARPLRRGEMEPIDDYRPAKRSPVIVDEAALDRGLLPAIEKPVRQIPAPQPKPAAPKPKAEHKILAKGEMEPVDDVPGPKALITRRGEASTFRCFVRDVMAFYDRTHIRCYNKARNKLNFFAVDTSQPISASLVSKGLAAMQAGKPATITFAPEADLNPSNCAAANCRRLIDIQN